MDNYNDKTRYGGDPMEHKKMWDFARDTIRVTNPLDTEFRWQYDSKWFAMQPGQTKDEARYWTDHYAKTLADYILGQTIDKKAEEVLAKQAQSNSDILYDKYIESMRVWMRIPRKDDHTLLEKVMGSIVLGCVKKYGSDEVEAPADQRQVGNFRDKSFEQQLLEDLSNRTIDDTKAVIADAPAPSESIAVSDRSLESEVTSA